jgi:hypothetical protein
MDRRGVEFLPHRGFVRDAVKAAMEHVRSISHYEIPGDFTLKVKRIHRVGPSWPEIERRTARLAIDIQYSPQGWCSVVGVMPDLSASVWMD